MTTSTALVWFNPACSKCRGLRTLLEERGVKVEFRHYLDQPPTAAEIEELLHLLGEQDPRVLMRTKESAYAEAGLGTAGRQQCIQALEDHPQLLQRPVLVFGDRAVIARPPEKALEILDQA